MTQHSSGEAAPIAGELDRERVRNFIGLSVARVGPRAFDVTHNTFLTLFIGARTGSALLVAVALTGHRFFSWLVWPLAGRVSDATRSRFGRRAPYLGGGLVLMGVLTWAYTVIQGFWFLVAAIVIARTANTVRNLASITVVPETFGRSRWIRALVATAIAGFVVSLSVRVTVIATWDDADPTTWNLTFRMAGAFMVAAGVVVFALVRDGAPVRKLAEMDTPRETWRERLAEILAVPNARLLLAGAFLTVATSGSTSRLLPLFNQAELGAGGDVQSVAIIVGGAGAVLLSVPAGVMMTMRLRRRTLATLGPATAAVGALLHLFVTNIWQTVAIGVVTAAFGTAALLALIAPLLQLLPRSGGMGERLGLVLGPFALVGVLSTLISAATVDVVDSYRVMWLFPAALGLANAIVNHRLWIPPWADRVDLRRVARALGQRARERRNEDPEHQARQDAERDLFRGEVEVDDVDASVVFEVLRHALGNPYEPPKSPADDEPEPARIARRVVTASSAPDARAVAEIAELIRDDVTLDDDGVERVGQPAVLEHLTGPDWSPWPITTPGRWRLAGVDGPPEQVVVSFQASPAPPTGEIDLVVHVSDGHVSRIERSTSATLAMAADEYARGLGYPVPTAIDLDNPDRRIRRRRARRTLLVVGWATKGLFVKRLLRRPIEPVRVARALRIVFERLGGGYVKFGQLVASSPSMFGEEVADEFRTTLDAAPAVAIDQVRRIIEEDLGAPFETLFSEIDEEPLGRASIAVVHRARTIDGDDVAVKVIRPNIEDVMATDLALMEPLFLRIAGPSAARLVGPFLQLLAGFRRQVSEELDLANERASMVHYRQLLATVDLPGVVVPEPVEALSGHRVLTMELLDGVAVDDQAAVAALGIDAGPVLEQVLKAWFVTAILHGTFHGDVHAGNLLLLRDGRVALIDWGIVGRLDPATHAFLQNLIAGALGRDAAWDELARFFSSMFGGLMARGGASEQDVVAAVRPRLQAMLTQPFGTFSLGAIISDNQRRAAEEDGEQLVERRRRRRAERAKSNADAEPFRLPPFNRGLFLLGKQLLYFERYGRIHLSDTALLEDEAFFLELVDQAQQPGGDRPPATMASDATGDAAAGNDERQV